MNRFERRSEGKFTWVGRLFMPALLVCALIFFVVLVGNVETSTGESGRASLERAINRSILQCYAIEGAYPPDMEYLSEHYGITYDKSDYFVDYDSYGANLKPDVTVLRRHHE